MKGWTRNMAYFPKNTNLALHDETGLSAPEVVGEKNEFFKKLAESNIDITDKQLMNLMEEYMRKLDTLFDVCHFEQEFPVNEKIYDVELEERREQREICKRALMKSAQEIFKCADKSLRKNVNDFLWKTNILLEDTLIQTVDLETQREIEIVLKKKIEEDREREERGCTLKEMYNNLAATGWDEINARTEARIAAESAALAEEVVTPSAATAENAVPTVSDLEFYANQTKVQTGFPVSIEKEECEISEEPAMDANNIVENVIDEYYQVGSPVDNQDVCRCEQCENFFLYQYPVYFKIIMSGQIVDVSSVKIQKYHGLARRFLESIAEYQPVRPTGKKELLEAAVGYLFGTAESGDGIKINVNDFSPADIDKVVNMFKDVNVNVKGELSGGCTINHTMPTEMVEKISNPKVDVKFSFLDIFKSDKIGAWLSVEKNFDFIITVIFGLLVFVECYFPCLVTKGLCGIVGIYMLYRGYTGGHFEKVTEWVFSTIKPTAENEKEDGAWRTVVQAFAFLLFGQGVDCSNIASFGKTVGDFNKYTKNLVLFCDNIQDFLISCIKMVCEYFTLDFNVKFSKYETDLKSINEDLCFVNEAIQSRDITRINHALFERFDGAEIKFRKLEMILRYSKDYTFVHNFMRNTATKFDMLKDILHKYRSSDLKMEPAVLMLLGAPNTGKTTVSPDIGDAMICSTMSEAELIDYESHPGKHTYSHSMGSDYYDPYENQKIIALNDFMMNTEAEGKPAETALLMQAKGSNKLVLNAAELHNKGKITFNALLLLISSNATRVNKDKLKSLAFTDGLTRRLNENCWMVHIKKEYQMDNSPRPDDWSNGPGYDADDTIFYGSIDKNKVEAAFGFDDENLGYSNDIYLFTEWDIKLGGVLPGGRRSIEYEEFKEIQIKYFKKTMTKSENCMKYRVNNLKRTVQKEFQRRRDEEMRKNLNQVYETERDNAKPTAKATDEISSEGLGRWLRRYMFHCYEAMTRVTYDTNVVIDMNINQRTGDKKFTYKSSAGYFQEDRNHPIHNLLYYLDLTVMESMLGSGRADYDALGNCDKAYPFTDKELLEMIFRAKENLNRSWLGAQMEWLFAEINDSVESLVKDSNLAKTDPNVWIERHPYAGFLNLIFNIGVAYLVFSIVTKLASYVFRLMIPDAPPEENVSPAGAQEDIDAQKYETMLLKNHYNFLVRRKEKVEGGHKWITRRPCSFLGLCGSAGITVHHAWQMVKDLLAHGLHVEIGLMPIMNLRQEAIRWFDAKEVVADESRQTLDIVKLIFPKTMPAFRNICCGVGKRKCQFPSIKNNAVREWLSGTRDVTYYNCRSVTETTFRLHTIHTRSRSWVKDSLPVVTSYSYVTRLNGSDIGERIHYLRKGDIVIDRNTMDGDCGSFAVCTERARLTFASEQPVFQHTVPFLMNTGAGAGSNAICIMLTKELLEEWFTTTLDSNDPDQMESIEEVIGIVRKNFGIVPTASQIETVLGIESNIAPWQTVVGIQPAGNFIQKSDFSKSDYFFDMFPCTHKPSRLRPFQRDGVWIYPMEKARYNYGQTVSPESLPFANMKRVCLNVYDDIFKRSTKYVEPATLTFEQAVAGDTGLELKSLAKDTSAGFYMGMVKTTQDKRLKGKKFIFGDSIVDFNDPMVVKTKQTVTDLLDAMVDGGLPCRLTNPNICNLKSELLINEKVREGKSRVFMVSDGFFQIADKMLFGSIMLWIVKNRITNSFAIGMDGRNEFDLMIRMLLGVGENLLAGDFSKFDKYCQIAILECVFDFVRKFYGSSDPLNNKRREARFADIKHGVAVFYCEKHREECEELKENLTELDPAKAYFVMFMHGLFSGIFGTALFGSLGSCVVISCSAVACMMGSLDKFRGSTGKDIDVYTKKFIDNSYFCYQGDDHTGSVSKRLPEVNFKNFCLMIPNFGMSYQSCNKVDEDFLYQTLEGDNPIMFLRRKARELFFKGMSRYVGALDLESLLKPILWEKDSYTWSIRHDMLQNVVIEASVHPESIFNFILSKVEHGLKEHAPPEFKFLKYATKEQCVEQFVNCPLYPAYNIVEFAGDKNFVFDRDETHVISFDVKPTSSSADLDMSKVKGDQNTKPICDETTTTCFVDDKAIVDAGVPAVTSINMIHETPTDIKKFLAKPYPVGSFIYTTGVSVNGNLFSYEPSTLLSNAFYSNKMQGYGIFRGTAVFRIEYTHNPFMAGALLAHFIPNYTELAAGDTTFATRYNTQLISKFMHPHEMAVIPEDDCTIIKIPYVSPSTHYDVKAGGVSWGTLYVDAVTLLRTGSSTATNVNAEVYLYFEDVELKAPVYPQCDQRDMCENVRPTSSSSEHKEADNHWISKGLSQVSKAASSLGDVPYIGGVSKDLAWFTRIASGVASAFGFSRPVTEAVIQPVSVQTVRYMGTGSGSSTAVPLALVHDNCVEEDMSRRIRKQDEMSFEFLRSIWILNHNQGNTVTDPACQWTASNATNVQLMSFTAAPAFHCFQATTTHNAKVMTYQIGGPLFNLGTQFKFQTGSMEIMFVFLATKFHKGKVMITFSPGSNVGTLPTVAQSMLARKAIISLGDTKRIKMTLPYELYTPFVGSQSYIGKLEMKVLVPLTYADNCSSTVDILAFWRGGADYQLAGPCESQYALLPVTPVSDDRDIVDIGVIGGGPSPSPSREMNKYCIGESFDSIKQLLVRPSYYPFVSSNTAGIAVLQPWAVGGCSVVSASGAVTFPNSYGDTFSFLAPWYLYGHGSINLIAGSFVSTAGLCTPVPMAASVAPMASTLALTSTSTTTPFNLNNNGAGYVASFVNYKTNTSKIIGNFVANSGESVLEIKVPYYSYCPVTWMPYYDGQNTNTLSSSPYYVQTVAQINNFYNVSVSGVSIYRSVGDDFTMSYFIGCPAIINATT